MAVVEWQTKSVMPPWYRWVVLVACLYMNLVVNGYTYCFGLLKIPLMDEYQDVSAATLAIVGGLVPSMYMFIAPVSIATSEYLGIRVTTMAAAFLSSLCFVLTWLNGVFFHFGFIFDLLCLGIGQGIAFGFLYGPSIAILPSYFSLSELALAAGIANAGSAIGTIIYGFISNPLFSTFGWRGTMLFYAGISLQGTIAGMAFMPLVSVLVIKADDTKLQQQSETKGEISDEVRQALLTQQDAQPPPKPAPPRPPKKEFLQILKRYFDLNLFKQWPFVCMIGAAAFSIIGYFVPTLLMPQHAKAPGSNVQRDVALYIMSVFGVLNLIGRLILGKVGDLGNRYAIFTPYWLYIASLTIGGISFLIFPHVMYIGTVPFVIFAVTYGFSAAPIITMRSLLTTTLFGKKNANASYGWFLSAQGGLQLVGFILPAYLEQNFGAIWAYSFGAIMFFSAAFCCAITFKPYFGERKKQIRELAR